MAKSRAHASQRFACREEYHTYVDELAKVFDILVSHVWTPTTSFRSEALCMWSHLGAKYFDSGQAKHFIGVSRRPAPKSFRVPALVGVVLLLCIRLGTKGLIV